MKLNNIIVAGIAAAMTILAQPAPTATFPVYATLGINPNGKLDTAFHCLNQDQSDCTTPGAGTLAISTIANISILNGATGTMNLRSAYVTGTEAATATLVTTCSPTLAGGFTTTANGLSWTTTTTYSGICTTTATGSGNPVSSNVYVIASSAAAVSDTSPPTAGTGLSITLNGSNKPVLVFDPSCDPYDSGSSGLASYKVRRDGVALTPVTVIAPIQSAYTSIDIGTLSPVGTSTQSNGFDWLDTAEGQILSGIGNDELRFSYRSVTGNFIGTTKLESFANVVNTNARAGIMARDGVGAQDAFIMAQITAANASRMQYRATPSGARAATGLGSIALPVWLQLERAGDTWTTRQSVDGNIWVDVSQATQAMPTTLNVGRATASHSDGNAVSAQYRQLCVTTLGKQTYTDTAASAGNTHTYTVSWLDASANESAQSASVSIVVPPAPVTNAIKWHPGHYKFNQTQQTATNTVSNAFYTDLNNEPAAIKGIMQPYYWAALEPTTAGVYTWTTLDQKLNLLKGMGKRMIVYLRTRSCCSPTMSPVNFLPTYILNDAQYGSNVYAYGTSARIWQQATMDRVIALTQAIADRYDSEPAFEGIATDETALGFSTSSTPPADFTKQALETQYERWLKAWRVRAPHTQMWVWANYLQGGNPEGTLIKNLHSVAVANQVGAGGPDSPPHRNVTGYDVVQGTVPSPGGHDFRDEISLNYIGMSYIPYYGTDTAQDNYDFVKNTLHGQYISWKPKTDGTSAQNWTTGVIPVIQAHPTIITTCPTSFAACDTSN